MKQEWGGRGMQIGYWWESRKERTTRKTKSRWVDDIKMDLRWDGMDWIELAQDRDQ
jgi:hypothetical protein